jgi:hypothetical protein
MSESASGTVAGLVTHSSWKGRSYARMAVTPDDPKSTGQVSNRAALTFLSHNWGSTLSAADRATWDAQTTPAQPTPFNAFLKYNLDRWHQGKAPSKRPNQVEAGVDGLWVVTPVAFGAVRSIRFEWQPGAVLNNSWGVMVSVVDPAAPLTTPLVTKIDVAKVGVKTIVIVANLTPGPYTCQLRAFSDTGKLLTNRGPNVRTATP